MNPWVVKIEDSARRIVDSSRSEGMNLKMYRGCDMSNRRFFLEWRGGSQIVERVLNDIHRFFLV